MKYLKILLNILLFAVYSAIGMFIVGALHGIISGVLGKGEFSDVVFNKMGYLIIVVVFVVTIIFRKYFYLSLGSSKQKNVSMKKTTHTVVTKKETTKVEVTKEKDNKDPEMKIYIDKEIK